MEKLDTGWAQLSQSSGGFGGGRGGNKFHILMKLFIWTDPENLLKIYLVIKMGGGLQLTPLCIIDLSSFWKFG